MLNTLILITGSFFVARAVSTIKQDQREKTILFLWLTFIMGAAYCVIKIWEYQWNVSPALILPVIIFSVFIII